MSSDTMMLAKYIVVLLVTTISQAMSTYSSQKSVCGNGFCGKISYDEILQLYRGLFFTDEQRELKEQKMLVARERELNNDGLDVHKVLNLPGDGDSCCATEFTHIKPDILPNVDGVDKYIVHMSDKAPAVYQLIPQGSCVQGYGKCDGNCVMEPLILNLLVYDTSPSAAWPPLTFDWFEVPGYCSCKNTHSLSTGGSSGAKLQAAPLVNKTR